MGHNVFFQGTTRYPAYAELLRNQLDSIEMELPKLTAYKKSFQEFTTCMFTIMFYTSVIGYGTCGTPMDSYCINFKDRSKFIGMLNINFILYQRLANK